MLDGLYITDFHAHLRGSSPSLPNFCAHDTHTRFFQKTAPLFERFLRLSEPIHEGLIRWLALNYRGALSRHIYSSVYQITLMEALRLFKVYDLFHLLCSMDKNGIDHAIVCSLEPFISTQEILAAVAPYRDRISVFASVASTQPNPAEYLSKHLENPQVCGLKIHPIVGGYACNELFWRTKDTVSLAVARNLPILIHTGDIPSSAVSGLAGGCSDVSAVEPLVAAFPQGKFVLAHIGWESWRQVLRLAKTYPHVCVETSWQPEPIIRRAVDMLGAQRVLFGSDFPLFKERLALRIARQALTDREFAFVASINARRLLNVGYHAQQAAA